MENFDFCGWATRNNLRCSDGRVIRKDAFKGQDGTRVPLVWNHQHSDPNNCLGHALLKNREDGVYAYCKFNETESGKSAKILVEHGDITSLSIFANQLRQNGSDVIHGSIREVSLVLAGANPGARIETVIKHDDTGDESGIIYSGFDISLYHSEEHSELLETDKDASVNSSSMTHADSENGKDSGEKKKTFGEILKTMNAEQREAVDAIVGMALNAGKNEKDSESDNKDSEKTGDNGDTKTTDTEGGDKSMKHNVFDNTENQIENTLSHDAVQTIISDAKRFGSMRESVLQHAVDYGITQIDYLIPDPKAQTTVPEFIKRDTGWVSDVMGAIHRTPFSRIKSLFADITEDEARAKGYLKGKLKKEEVFGLLKRTTQPTTIYKKQKMDRDDVIDITDFDVIAWLKTEMRMMLDEEIARAALLGDGRLASSDDKINEQCIRPVWKDEELFTIKHLITVSSGATADDKAKAFIRGAIKSRKDYRGSGNPTLYTTEDFLTDMLLLTDVNGRDLYESVDKLAQKLRVSKIVTVPVMEGVTDSDGSALLGIIVNMKDYTIGADKGGAVNMFEDFDIDYNQQKYLIETRCSGSLTKPYSAIALTLKVSG